MSFVYPLGLLGLLAIPVLILIYIIKNKYTEQVVSATYLWTLSERFLKRKNPISKLAGIISLILQILAVIFISVVIAQPVITLRGAAHDYCFILDGSGSMNIAEDNSTRLERGKNEIISLIQSSAEGSAYTLVYASESADVIFDGITDKERARTLVSGLDAQYGTSSTSVALEAAQRLFDENASVLTYLVTDKAYAESENVFLINVSRGAENYSVSDVVCSTAGGKLSVSGTVCSYESDKTLTVSLYLDGANEPALSQSVESKKGEDTAFLFDTNFASYTSVRVAISEADALSLDNECVVYNVSSESAYKTLVVSESPFFVKAVLGVTNVDTVSPDEYLNQSGYGLYVFDSFTPQALPQDGAVWFFNPVSSCENAGFSVQSEISLLTPARMVYSTSSKTTIRTILSGLLQQDIYVKSYVKCGLYRSFDTILSVDGNPTVFAGTNAFGNREVVFAFSLKETDVALMADFVPLANSLLHYTFPPVLESSLYVCGDTVQINVPANCDSIRVVSPLGKVTYPNTGVDIAEYTASEVGTYTVTLMSGSSAREVKFYSVLPLAERAVSVSESEFKIVGTPSFESRDGVYKDLLYLFILLAVLFIADWGVYCYEQYQLR